MKLLYTWTGVIIVALLALATLALAVVQYAQGQRPTALISTAGLGVVAVVLARRILKAPKPAATGPSRTRLSGPGGGQS